MTVIKFDNVSKKYKLYSKGGLYLRDRITHALKRFISPNGRQAQLDAPAASPGTPGLALGTEHALEKDFWALKNVSFEIKKGESIAFIGRNGAGKSTILKLLAGVTKPSSGSVDVDGRVAAMIEVGAGFHPELTGRENVYLNGSILGMRKWEIDNQLGSIVNFAELEDFMDTPVKHYSSGMYVRLGFAIAAHTNPDIYLIDEVLAVGDQAFQKKCIDTLAAHRAAGKTMILVTHSLDKIAEICDRCIYLSHGETRFDGKPIDTIEQYQLDVAGITSRNSGTSTARSAKHFTMAAKGKAESDFAQNGDMDQCKDDSIPADIGRGEGFVLHVKKYQREIVVSCGDAIALEFEIEAPAPISEATVGVTLVDLYGAPIVSMSSKVQNIPRVTESSKSWKAACNMGAIPLNAGMYLARIYVGNGRLDCARFSDVFAIRVTAKDVFGWGDCLPGVESWGATYWAPEWNIEPK